VISVGVWAFDILKVVLTGEIDLMVLQTQTSRSYLNKVGYRLGVERWR